MARFTTHFGVLTVCVYAALSACGDDGDDSGVAEDGGAELTGGMGGQDSVNAPGMGGIFGMDGAIGLPPIVAPPSDASVLADGGEDAALDASAGDAGDGDASDGDAGDGDAGDGDASDDAAVGDGDGGPDATVDASVATCGLDQACCVDFQCEGDLVCLGERCGCIRQLSGDHYLRSDGSVYATGLGVIENMATGTPLLGITQIYEAHDVACGRRDDTSVWCWPTASPATASLLGRGPLAAPAVVRHAYPVLLPPVDGPAAPLTGVARINEGSANCYLGMNVCAVMTSGQLYCWGEPNSGGGGSIFNGNDAAQSYATRIMTATGLPFDEVDAVSTGQRHACALRNGEVYCWGANVNGPLGTGDEVARAYPTAVDLPAPAQEVGVTSDLTCARVSDNVYCWGNGTANQLGDGQAMSSSSPVQVMASGGAPLTGVVELDVHYQGACALLSNAELHCWGAGVSDVASQLYVSDAPIADVALYSSCGTAGITVSIAYVTTRNDYLRSSTVTQPVCP